MFVTYLNFVTRLFPPLNVSVAFGCLFLKVELVIFVSHDGEFAACFKLEEGGGATSVPRIMSLAEVVLWLDELLLSTWLKDKEQTKNKQTKLGFRTWAMKVWMKSHWMHQLLLWVPCSLSNRWRRRVLGMCMSRPHIRMMVSSAINEDLIISLWTQGFKMATSFTSWPWWSIKAGRYSCHGASSTVQWLLSNILEKWVETETGGQSFRPNIGLFASN